MESFNKKDEYLNKEDNLIYCSTCNAAKQKKIDREPFKGRVVTCLCKCEIKQHEAYVKKMKEQEESIRINALRTSGINDKSMWKWTFESDKGYCNQMDKAKQYCDKWNEMYKNNIGLLLFGNIGVGKTYFAACIANKLIESGVPVLMTNFSKILNMLTGITSEEKNNFIYSLNNYKLLIIDDFGIERTTEYATEQVYSVVDARYKNNQPFIITTNLSLEELRNPKTLDHKRIYSRVLEMCQPIYFTGNDLRTEKSKEKFEVARELFKCG